jgi:hypothetical protein
MSWTPSLSAGQGLRFVGVRMSHVLVLVDHLELFLCVGRAGGNIPTWSFSPRPAIKATHAHDFLEDESCRGESAAAVDDQQHLQRHLDLYACCVGRNRLVHNVNKTNRNGIGGRCAV